jgi:branched-chain amino acid transport system ATP-binding protein
LEKLEVKDIRTYYGESYILRGVTMSVRDSQVVALLGRNGMGKTTAIRSVVGFTPPRSGIIKFKDVEIQRMAPHVICQMGIGLVPQGRRIFPSLSVFENLTLAQRGKGWTLERVYAIFPRLKERSKIKGTMLSGGEQQMLCIARTLLSNPELVLMDEPSEGLSPLYVLEVGKIIKQLKREGFSILLVEQNLRLGLSVSDYVYILHRGEVVYQSKPADLAANEKAQVEYLAVTRS